MQGAEALLTWLRARSCATARAAVALLLIWVAGTLACVACADGVGEPVRPASASDGAPSASAQPAAPSAQPTVSDAQPAATTSAQPTGAAAPADPALAPTASADTIFNRPVVIGASASAGFGISVRENGAKPGDGVSVSLADILRVALDGRHTVEAYSSSMVFANPGPILSGEMERALRQSPTVIIGIDYLFWYVYGTRDASGGGMRTRDERLANLERGLAQVDSALARGIPVIVGDIPDMKAAIGKMLSRAQVPDLATLDAANARIREWAQARPGVRAFGLKESVMSISTNGSMRAGGTDWNVDDHGPLLLRDELHPSFPGLVAVASAVVESAATLLPEGSRAAFVASFDLDPMMVRRRLLDERLRELEAVRSIRPAADAPAAGAPPGDAPAAPSAGER